jgi:hypothetical protein
MKIRTIGISHVILSFVIATLVVSCGDKKFEKRGWTSGWDAGFPPPDRDKMLNDLLSNYTLTGMHCEDVIALLGPPNHIESGAISYKIAVDYDSYIDPGYTKDLYLYQTKDSVIYLVKVKENGEDPI